MAGPSPTIPATRAVEVPTFYFVRHAKAGSRSHRTGDDRKRPLSKKGIQQAEDLVGLFAHFPISDIMSSPYLRCVQTVEPLARARRMEVKQTPVLAEGQGLRAYDLFQDASIDHAVLCTHGDIVWEVVEDLVRRKVLPSFEEQFEKAGTWVVEVDSGSPVRARYIPAP